MAILHATPKLSFDVYEHRLIGENVKFTASPNTSGAFKTGAPDTIVIHFTAGSSLDSSVNVLTNAESGVSAHFALGRNGDIVQMLPTNKIGWHAGKSHYKGRSGLNRYSIGIELDNAGQLKPRGGGTYESWFGNVYGESEVIAAQHPNQSVLGYWHKYTDIQIASTISLCKVLCEHYPISVVVGHDEIAPSRKVDPGPAFPMHQIREQVLLGKGEDETHKESSGVHTGSLQREAHDAVPRHIASPVNRVANVSANGLNVRKGPNVSFPIIENGLHKGEVLKVLEKEGEWAKVSFTKVGWVNTRYINEVTEKSPFKT
ncbi:N-acetylmuramoyl-L-alanine amidase [Alteromonas mediterranea]|uniref:N-acetylmuramoyl-L-alanine amidase n=1 Tax=Alteromonas mediterranea TaxID=314275 RepID=A0AAC9JE34_9ALTE|nr:N-acetylmuramoyl-L-alanine amidase [Alteromonas mediterranea]APD90830.1 N-acetylmuramoyl-L-alanine amidase [Alteromonas mediterranea]